MLLTCLCPFDNPHQPRSLTTPNLPSYPPTLHLPLPDSFHKPGFKMHARILHHLFTVVDSGAIKGPLWDAAAKGPSAYPTNAAFVREYLMGLLSTQFPNMTQQQVAACVAGMFELKDFSVFKHHLRDFLIQTKQFASQVRGRRMVLGPRGGTVFEAQCWGRTRAA